MLRLVILSVLVASASAITECFEPGGGAEPCGTRNCPDEEMKCNDDKCKCSIGGSDELLCVQEEGDFFTSVMNDPKAHTMNNIEDADMPVPCMYLLSRATTTNPNGRQEQETTCDIKVFVHNTRAPAKGKQYVGGFYIIVEARHQSNNQLQKFHFKSSGYFDSAANKYCFSYAVSKNNGAGFEESPNKFLYRNAFKIGKKQYRFVPNYLTNKIQLRIPICGVSAMMRPANPAVGVSEQTWMPGFALVYDKNLDPKFLLDHNKVISLPVGTTLNLHPQDRPGTDHLTYRAFTGPGSDITDFPFHSAQCAAASNAMRACPGNTDPDADVTTRALRDCNFILRKVHFVRCFSDNPTSNVDRILYLYTLCIHSMCQKDVLKCQDFRQTLQDLPRTCKDHAPRTMVEHDCSF